MNEKMKQKPHAGKGTFARLISYIFSHYRIHIIAVIICIIISSIASVIASVFLQRLIDECILPGVQSGMGAVWKEFISIITMMATVYVLGVLAAFIYTRIMAVVTQGTLMHLRIDMFDKMEKLPVKFFDTHAHGDIMSTYTNDTDAIRQLIGQSLPTVIQSALTITAMILMMLYYSLWLSIAVFVFIFIMTKIVNKVGGASSKYMMAQQRSLAKEEGFVEEMMNGQKVVKVFCHEDESKEDFIKLNEQLFKDSESANSYGNILMPILNNVGNIMYVLLAVFGGLLVYFNATNIGLQGVSPVTIGIIVSFLGMTRQLSQTIGQASMQVSMIAMGVAGASRIFELIDQTEEKDEGYVTLPNVQ